MCASAIESTQGSIIYAVCTDKVQLTRHVWHPKQTEIDGKT